MQRMFAMVMALALFVSAAAVAQAVEIKQKGEYVVTFELLDNGNFQDSDEDGESEDDFSANQRFRWYLDFIANENLKGVVGFEIGDDYWGEPGELDLSGDGVDVEVKHAYVDFFWPMTELNIKAGLMAMELPGAVQGSTILNDDLAALVLSYPFSDSIEASLYWSRLQDDNTVSDGVGVSLADEVDMFGLNFYTDWEGFHFDPFVMVASVGVDNSRLTNDYDNFLAYADGAPVLPDNEDHILAYILGLALEVDAFDPFLFALDFNYGATDAEDEEAERSGYYLAASLDYKMETVTPGVWAWYASGEDDENDNGSEQMPFVYGGAGRGTLGIYDSTVYVTELIIKEENLMGLWGVGLQLDKFSFVDDLTHTLRLIYMQGASDADSRGDSLVQRRWGSAPPLTEDDSVFEINFDHKYKLYKNLELFSEMGVLFPNYDDDDAVEDADEICFGFALGLKYKF